MILPADGIKLDDVDSLGMLELMNLEVLLEQTVKQVNSRLEQLLPAESEQPSELHAAMRYSCLAPGKRLRPLLVQTCAAAVNGDPLLALDAGCALEMIHCFSLIHDDLPALDNDNLRRGRPTCHVQYGEAVAILAGDALFALALETLSSIAAPPVQVVECLRVLTKAIGTMGLVGGETVDILSEGKVISSETLDLIHNRKTASLISASCEIGSIFSPVSDPEVRHKMRTYGECIGLAFQIADDVLNEVGTPEQLGKAVGSDRERMKATYPSFYGVEASRARALELAHQATEIVSGFANSEHLKAIALYSVQRMN